MTPGPDDFSTAETLANDQPRRRLPRPLLVVAVTALVVTAGAGVAAAAAFSPSPATPTPTATATATATPTATPTDSPTAKPSDKARGRGWGWGGRFFGMGGGIHGEFVVPGEEEGQYITVATQLGEVTAIDQDSVTVKSEDGYSREYVVNGDTRINAGREGIDAIKTGDQVAVRATVSGNTATAVTILDLTRPAEGRWHHRHPWDRGDHPGRPGDATPTPEGKPTA